MTRSIKLNLSLVSLWLVAVLLASIILPTGVVRAINTPWLSVSGRFIRDPQGNNVVLRGVSLIDVSVANSRPRNAVTLTNMLTDEANGWYARVVRFPVYPNAIDGQPGWLANPDAYFNNHLDPAIQNCVARQIYCIIDWHYIQDYNNSTVDTATRAFWNYVAPRYANTPNVIFELYNEPINPDNWSTWKQWAQPWVDIIRSHAPDNLILIGGPRWSQNLSSAATDPFVGNNLVYVAHIYPQHGGQSTWDSWFGNAANSVPFFITEWGWQQGGAIPTSGTLSGYGIPFSTYMESKGLSWTAWVFDQYWQPVMFDQSYNLLGGENYMGQYTKDFLFQHRNDNLPGGGPTNTPSGATFTPTRTNTPSGGNNTGWVSPSNQAAQSGGDANGFQISATNAFADAGGSAQDVNSGTNSNTSCTSTGKDRHAYFNYPLSIPGGSTIAGIEVRLDAWADSATGTRRMCVEVSWNNGASWTAVKTSPALSTSEASYILGSSTDTWGRTWSTSELTSANFRVRITNVSNNTSRDFNLDWVPVRVHYSSGGVITTPTQTSPPIGPTFTPTRTNTPVMGGNLKVQLRSSGKDDAQRSDFYYRVVNTGTSPQSNISVRIYFTPDGSQAASSYVLEKWWDQSNVATVSGPTQASGSTYYFTVNYGSASLAAGASWEYQTTLHLSNWSSNHSGANDWWHTAGTLPSAYTDWTNIPAYVSGSRVWGSEPGGGTTASQTPTRTNTPTGPTFTPTRTPTRTNTPSGPTFTPTRTPTNPPQGTHLDNPFVGANFYRNVDYVSAVNAAADLQGGPLGQQMRQVANYPTFVWLDSIAAVHGTNGYPRSLVGHLDQALAQSANAIGIVVYDLPNRDCSALASNGELLVAQDGLNRYKTEYIDAIYNAISQPKYANLRIIAVIEPDSLPNLVTNLSFPKCAEAQSSGAYVQGVQYAVSRIRSLNNAYAYIDVAHAAWLGWPSNFNPFVTLLKQVGTGITGGNSRVDGFISNTANYNPVDEPYMDANTMVNGQPVRSLQGWYDWNDYIDEQPYLIALRNALTSGKDAYPTSVGLLIDTSRNGWGGPNRPTGPSTSTDLFTFVMATRIDKRIHKGNWCNQDGAGIGARPAANPVTGIDAFVWVKPPGESDGSSSLIPIGPQNPTGKGFDQMCDPNYHGNQLNGNNFTGALPNAPVSGRWFQAQFVQLVQNAYPLFQP